MELQDKTLYPEFNVKVIKDAESTLSKSLRFSEQDVHVIPTRTDVSSARGSEVHWTQVQATPAYALTCD